jgi:phosphoglucomutase
VTSWIESKANDFLERGLDGVKRTLFSKALHAPTTHKHDFLSLYVSDLNSVVDMNAVRDAKIKLGVDPLGGAGIDYWPRIAEQYGLDLTIVNKAVDPTFRFMTVDWDGKIRMDPSSPYAMQRLIALKDKFDIAFASDTDHDRHGIVTKSSGLLPPNHYLSVCVSYLFANRPNWSKDVAVGKTVVSSSMIDRVSARLGRRLYEVPVGFKWFVEGLLAGRWVSAARRAPVRPFSGATAAYGPPIKTESFLVCSQQKLPRVGKDPGEIYRELTRELGDPVYERIDAPATPEAKSRVWQSLSPSDIHATEVGGQPIQKILDHRSGRRQSNWRNQSDCQGWLVCGTSFRHRGNLQDLRREFPRSGPSATDRDKKPRPLFRKRWLAVCTRNRNLKTSHDRSLLMSSSTIDDRPLDAGISDALTDLALDLRWSFNHSADQLWGQLDPNSGN